jgi:hypothetical protein
MLLTVLQFAPDSEVYAIVERLVGACSPGSFLMISHPASDIEAERHSDIRIAAGPGSRCRRRRRRIRPTTTSPM